MDLIIQTTKGKVEGFETEDVHAWYGIPFAAPLVGDLRFKRAQSIEPLYDLWKWSHSVYR